jgi:hypothetical protein
MNAIISISSSYGFDHNWSLDVTFRDKTSKSFYLGQDCKFCTRVLNMEPAYVIQQTGIRDLTIEKNKKAMARFIIESLDLTEKQLKGLQAWELCCQ